METPFRSRGRSFQTGNAFSFLLQLFNILMSMFTFSKEPKKKVCRGNSETSSFQNPQPTRQKFQNTPFKSFSGFWLWLENQNEDDCRSFGNRYEFLIFLELYLNSSNDCKNFSLKDRKSVSDSETLFLWRDKNAIISQQKALLNFGITCGIWCSFPFNSNECCDDWDLLWVKFVHVFFIFFVSFPGWIENIHLFYRTHMSRSPSQKFHRFSRITYNWSFKYLKFHIVTWNLFNIFHCSIPTCCSCRWENYKWIKHWKILFFYFDLFTILSSLCCDVENDWIYFVTWRKWLPESITSS